MQDRPGIARRLFGKLHNQIVLPLLIASVIVAVLATFIATWVVAGPIASREKDDAKATAGVVQAIIDDTASQNTRDAQLLSEDPRVMSVALARNAAQGNAVLAGAPGKLNADGVTILDERGRVLASNGGEFTQGQDLAALPVVQKGLVEMRASDIVRGAGVANAIAGVSTIWVRGGGHGLVMVTTLVNDRFLAGASKMVNTPLVYFDPQGRVVASTLGSALDCLIPKLTPTPPIFGAVAGGRSHSVGQVTCPKATFYVAYSAPVLGSTDPGVVAVVRPSGAVAAAQLPTAGLIALWSLVAVALLGLLGISVAQSVSRPIVELAASARRVSEGDLSPHIAVGGRASDEIIDLAQSFNQMTDGLRRQTDDLTKRLLELTTLYEMSKAVGTTLDSEHLLETVLDSSLKVLGADVGYVMLLDPETGRLSLKAWRAPAEVLLEEEALSNSIGSWVLREGKPLVFGHRPGTRPSLELGGLRTRSALCVPMKSKNTVKGVITVAVMESDIDLSQENVNLLVTIANQAAIALDNTELFDSLQQAYLATVRALAAAVDAKDPYTHGHSEQVADYAMLLADEIGLPDEEKSALQTAAYLHDIGKIGIKDDVLLKPGRLDEDEMAHIRHHPLIGSNILAPVPFPWAIIPIVRHHHERWNGGGYPAGLVGEEIPRLARVLAIADAFEAMTSDRPYRKANTLKEAVEELRRCAGQQFDPNMVEPFLAALDRRGAAVDNVRVLPLPAPEQADEDEVTAVFVSVADSLLASLRRLGGPRVATNFQHQMNAHFRERGMPVAFDSGHLSTRFDRDTPPGQEIGVLKQVLAAEMYAVERSAGSSIAEHFYSDAIDALPSRHQRLASQYGFDRSAEGSAS